MTDRLVQLLHDQGVDAAIQFAIDSSDAISAVTALDELMRDCYWKQKDLASSVKIGVAAAPYALATADKMTPDQSEVATALRGKAKAIYYNLASFSWRGWGEIGIETRPYETTVGLDAARENLRLAVELVKGDLPISRAHWMLGALQMSAEDYRAADRSFGKAVQFARLAGARDEECGAIAFGRLNNVLAGGKSHDPVGLMATGKIFSQANDGPFFAKQFAKAVKIFLAEGDTVA